METIVQLESYNDHSLNSYKVLHDKTVNIVWH